MAITDVELAGYVRSDNGDPVSGITVSLMHASTDDGAIDGTDEDTTTTNSYGYWTFTETDVDANYDIKIASDGGGQIRYIPWVDEITLKTVDTSVMKVRGASNTAAAPIYLFADLATDAGDGWRIQATDSDTLAIGSDKASAGTIIDYITITNGANAAASNTTILGQLTIGVNDTGADVKFFGATSGKYWLWDESADGVVQIGTLTVGVDGTGYDVKLFGATSGQYLLWDESSDELVLAGDTKLSFHDAAGGENIIASANGHLEVNAGTTLDITAPTVDINGAVALDGAITGATNITLSGELDAATLDISGNADIDGTLEADAYTVNGVTLSEYIADTAGAMFSSNTETGIAVTYQDGDNTIDLALSAAQTTITSLLATDIKIGEDDQTKIDFEDANTINFYANNAKEVVLAENSISPGTTGGTALGTTTLMWSDLFLASGSVINFNNGDVTLTHSSNTLTMAGGDLQINGSVVGATGAGFTLTSGAMAFGETTTISSASNTNLTLDAEGNGNLILQANSISFFDMEGSTNRMAIGLATLTAATYMNVVTPISTDASATFMGMDFQAQRGITSGATSTRLQAIRARTNIDSTNTQNWTATVGVRALVCETAIESGAAGTLTGVAAAYFIISSDQNAAGIMTNAYDIYIANGNYAAGNATNQYGIYIENKTVGTKDYGIYIAGAATYAIWVDADSIRLDGSLWVESTPTEGSSGEQLTSGGSGAVMTWAAASSLPAHKNILDEPLSPRDALDRILNTGVYRFHYKEGFGTGDVDTEYVGIMADEAPWAMHYGGGIVNPVNTLGYTVLAFQAIEEEIEVLRQENKELRELIGA